jgi:hypothetical protein
MAFSQWEYTKNDFACQDDCDCKKGGVVSMFGGFEFCLLRIEMFDQRLNAAIIKYIRCLHIFLKNDLQVFSE